MVFDDMADRLSEMSEEEIMNKYKDGNLPLSVIACFEQLPERTKEILVKLRQLTTK